MPQDWRPAYQQALLETDPQKLAGKIDNAMKILQDRLAGLDDLREHLDEMQLIADALRNLDTIRRFEIHSIAGDRCPSK